MTPGDDVFCQSYAPDYSALLDAELEPERETELRAHLASCWRCREQLAALQRVDVELEALAAPAVPADLRTRLQARIDADAEAPEQSGALPGRAAPRRRRRWLSTPAAAVAVAAAAAIALYLAVSSEREALPSAGTSEPPIAKQPIVPAPVAPEQPPIQIAETPTTPSALPAPATSALDVEPVEDVAVALDLETVEDLDVIANLELLEALVALGEGTG